MNICIPKERRTFEFRVGMTPSGVRILDQLGHKVYVEHEAGLGAGFSDQDYMNAGASIVYSSHEVFGRADLLLKVARPTYEELEWLQPNTIVAGLLHLSSARENKIDMLESKNITALAYEHIELEDGTFPVRKPLSLIGGRLAAQIGANLLQNNNGGKGILLGGMAGVPPAEIVIIGAGVVGSCAAKAFLGMGAHVTVLDLNLEPLENIFENSCNVVTMVSNELTVARACSYADIVVGAVLKHGERAPIVVTREMVKAMKPRSIIMDISIDEGGCVETSRPTTNEHPTFVEEGIMHYCVPNMPSVVARTSTYAFLNAASPYLLEIVNKGIDKAIEEDPAVKQGVILYKGDYHSARLIPQK